MFYVYVHKRAGEVFYVGLGQRERWTDTRSRNRFHKTIWDKALAEGTFSKEKVFHGTREECGEEEKRLIAKFGRRSEGGTLTNLTEGGDGGNTYTPDNYAERVETQRRNTNALWRTESYRKNHREGMRNSEKVKKAQRQRFSTPEGRLKHAQATQKKGFSEEDRKSLWGTANKGRRWFHNPHNPSETWLGHGEPPLGFVRGRVPA